MITKKLLIRLQIDKDLSWTLINKIWALIKGPLTMAFIISYLSIEEQGIWFTFLSLGALSVFAELGFTLIITQFISHEYAYLRFKNGFIVGKKQSVEKLFSLVRYALKFYFFVVPLAIIIMGITGWFVFSSENHNIILIWLLYSIVGGIQLILSLLNSIIQGFDKVELVQKNILIGSIFTPVITWICLYFDFGLFSLVYGNSIGIIIMIIFLYLKTKSFWIQLFLYKINNPHSWFNEIIHLQWKYAVSWISGYFISFFFVPVIFKFKGAVLAGQFGLSLALIAVVSSTAISWIDVKVPKLNILVSKKDKIGLDNLFFTATKISFVLFLILLVFVYFLVILINEYNFYNDRLLDPYLTFLLIFAHIPKMLMNYLGKYSRLHKAEPLYFMSIVTGIVHLVIISFLSYDIFTLEYLLISLIFINWFFALPYSYVVVKKFLDIYYKS